MKETLEGSRPVARICHRVPIPTPALICEAAAELRHTTTRTHYVVSLWSCLRRHDWIPDLFSCLHGTASIVRERVRTSVHLVHAHRPIVAPRPLAQTKRWGTARPQGHRTTQIDHFLHHSCVVRAEGRVSP